MNKLGPKEVVCVSVFQFMIFYLSAGGLKLSTRKVFYFPILRDGLLFSGEICL